MTFLTPTTGTELQLLLLSFVLSSLVGMERQFQQKSAGVRTHVLVALGATTFTLVSAYGFAGVAGGASAATSFTSATSAVWIAFTSST